MRQTEGSNNVALLECLNPKKGIWRVRLNMEPTETGAKWTEEDFDHKPTAEEVREVFLACVNAEIRAKIREGLEYEGSQVWLSTENQQNYKVAHDLAVQTDGRNLPLRVKLGTDEEPVYREFSAVEELADFYTAVATHVQSCLEEGWKKKEGFNVEPYLKE